MEGINAAEARREARRRRILLNSDDRLRKIKEGIASVANSEYDAEKSIKSCNTTSPVETTRPSYVDTTTPTFVETEEVPIWQSADTDNTPDIIIETPQSTTLIAKIFRVRAHIFTLAIAVRLLLLLNLGFLFADMVLVPLLIVQMTELLLPGLEERSSRSGGLLGAAMMLSGLTQSKTHGLLKTACWFRNIFTDLTFYLFTFFITHVLLQAF